MSSRSSVLAALRARPSASSPAPLPALDEAFCTYPDALAKFAEVLATVGGKAISVASHAEAQGVLQSEPAYQEAKLICSLVPGIGVPNLDLLQVADPHELEAVDFAVAPGRLAVAENAAVWVREADVPTRALLFITQHLCLVISRASLVSNMHEAYAQLELGGAEFGVFISGPSKTADIEQSLVIGAHGSRSLIVFVVG